MSSSKDTVAMSKESNEKSVLVPRLRFPEFSGKWRFITVGDFFEFGEKSEKVVNFDVEKVITVKLHTNGVVKNERTTLTGGANYFHRKAGQFVFSKIDLLNGAFGVIPDALDEFASSSDVPAYSFKTEQSPTFFVSWLKANYERIEIERTGTSSTLKRVLPEKFFAFAVAVPVRAEQQKIADCLSSLDELIAAENQKLDALKTHKKGLMQQLFPREGETVPRMRFPDFSEAGEWEERTLAEVCNVLQGYGFPEVLQGRSEGKYPFCKVSDISRAVAEKGGLLNQATNYVDDNDLLKLRAKIIPEGATVFAKIGEALRLNRRAYVQKECVIDNNATGLKAIDGVSDDYFVYLLSQLIDLNKHCGGAVPSVNKSTLEEIEVVVPGSNEQKRIAESLFSLDNCITAQSQKIDALKTHKKGLMQQLFPVLNEVPA